MASPLEGQIARAIAAGFKGKLRKGSLRRELPGVGVDQSGDANPGTVVTFRFEGIREDYSAIYRAQGGIPETDYGVLIIAGLIKTVPKRGDQIYLQQQWGQVRKISDIDPATATYQLQCFEISDPTV